MPAIGASPATSRRPLPIGSASAAPRIAPNGPASRPIPEKAGARAAPTKAATGPRMPLRRIDRAVAIQATKAPIRAQVNVLAENHQAVSTWTQVRLNAATAPRAAEVDPVSPKTSHPSRAAATAKASSEASVKAGEAPVRRPPPSRQTPSVSSSKAGCQVLV